MRIGAQVFPDPPHVALTVHSSVTSNGEVVEELELEKVVDVHIILSIGSIVDHSLRGLDSAVDGERDVGEVVLDNGQAAKGHIGGHVYLALAGVIRLISSLKSLLDSVLVGMLGFQRVIVAHRTEVKDVEPCSH